MKIDEQKKVLNEIELLKKKKSFEKSTLSEIQKLPTFNGVCTLRFNEDYFYMLNIENDDAVVLKYLWRGFYENISLKIWYHISRRDGICFDIGAHTGIYTIVGNINKKSNNIISLEPYFLNFSRLLANLKINKINPSTCYLLAASNEDAQGKFSIKTSTIYHSSGGKISNDGNLTISKIRIDKFKLNKKIVGIKIDTEGHEYEVIEGSKNNIKQHRPDIIFEINHASFDKCINLLKNFNYKFYFIDEENKKLTKIYKFDNSLKKPEGSNCLATINSTEFSAF